jgi:hypothetical protein
MSIPQPRRAKSSSALRAQAESQRSRILPPPLPTGLASTPPLFSDVSTVSTASSGLRTPPSQYVRHATISSPKKGSHSSANSALTQTLQLLTSELESYVTEADSNHEHNNVHVAIRLKPSFSLEKDDWKADPLRGFIGSKLGDFYFGTYVFCLIDGDYVYTGEDTNYGVYDASVRKLVRKAVEGYNGTVFAYGQTSSGKTHTMRGHTDEAGIISLAVADLFDEISSVYLPIFLFNSSNETGTLR